MLSIFQIASTEIAIARVENPEKLKEVVGSIDRVDELSLNAPAW
jgi:hypothetical protein